VPPRWDVLLPALLLRGVFTHDGVRAAVGSKGLGVLVLCLRQVLNELRLRKCPIKPASEGCSWHSPDRAPDEPCGLAAVPEEAPHARKGRAADPPSNEYGEVLTESER
jgi:hypothetical protein